MSEAGIYRRAGPRLHDAAIDCCARSAVKSLTPAERARRAGVLGIVLPGPPGPDAPPPPPAPRPSGTARPPIAGKLAAPAALRAKLGLPVAEPLPAPEPEPELSAPSTAPPPVDRPSGQDRKRALHRERYKRAHRLLAARWPAIFSAARPLAIGIDKQVRAILAEEELDTADLRTFFHRWTHRAPYQAALERGDRRVNLDGSDAGPAFDKPPEGVSRSS